MRKIYPPPFNKFVFFVFYSLLTLVTAQDTGDCISSVIESNGTNRIVVGYVQLDIDPSTIQWKLYDYINIIVSDFKFNNTTVINKTSALVKAKNENGNKTKILLSIRNYNLSDPNALYNTLYAGSFVSDVGQFMSQNNLNGVDIEYPGMRQIPCGVVNRLPDPQFLNLISMIKSTHLDKTVMLTVGSNTIDNTITPISLNQSIDLLNIETYHYSLYGNALTDNSTYPNSPFTAFTQAYYNWIDYGISKEKIIMGVDFGNTIQVVSNNSITNSQTVVNTIIYYNITTPPEVPVPLVQIGGICSSDQPPGLYSWPWKSLSIYALESPTRFCHTKFNWMRKTDANNTWLYRAYDPNPSAFYFVSYEDFYSLSQKLSFLTAGGISISNINYDDSNGTLSNYIRNNKIPNDDSANPGKAGSPNNPSNNPQIPLKNNNNIRVILGIVFGSLALILLVTSIIIVYQRKNSKNLVKSKEVGSAPMSPKKPQTTTRNDETPASPTTAIPVAGYVTAMFDFEGKEENDLSFKKGDKIEVLERGDGPNDWWVGRVSGTVGEFPGNYVKETG